MFPLKPKQVKCTEQVF
uniref:Uncharacterized protein n=1 Tax=Arundo donax TaxID=35708 RepID=A0A0A9B3N8_ARUDO